MKYETIVEQNEQGLMLICEKAMEFDRESVLEGISVRRYKEYEMAQLKVTVQEYHAKLLREINAVAHFAKKFNRQFATDNNRCFDTAARLFRKIRSSVSGTKRIYKSFCKTIRTRYPGTDGKQRLSVFTHSTLNRGYYTLDIYGEESYPKVVRELCDELESFFADLVTAILICRQVIRDEQAIRSNPKLLLEIYNEDSQVVRTLNQQVMALMREQKIAPTPDQMTQHKKSAHSLQAFLKETFHRYTREEFKQHKLNEELERGSQDGLEPDEAIYWANRHDLVPRVRLVIAHFDELEPRGNRDRQSGRYKIKGDVMARLVRWCGLEGSGFEKSFVEGYFRRHYTGELIPVNANTVNTAKNKFAKSADPGYEEFTLRVEELCRRYGGGL